MAKTPYEIYMDFVRVQGVAEELINIVEALRVVYQEEMELARSQINANWQGENADEYLRKVDLVQLKIKKTAQAVLDIERTIMTIADNIYKAEMEAIAIAND